MHDIGQGTALQRAFGNGQRAERNKWLAEKAFLEKKLTEKAKGGFERKRPGQGVEHRARE